MVQDLRLDNTFFVSKHIFFDPNISRRARAIYVSLCLLVSFEKQITIDLLAKSSGYNKQIVSRALKELRDLGFINKTRTSIDLKV